jgi:membrane-associated protease RseP (regulator of RpoE activity)
MSRRMLHNGLILGLACLAPTAGLAQERFPPPAPEAAAFAFMQGSRARVGVFLEPGCEIESDVRGDCAESPRVRAVVDGSPADLAGIQAGDVLLSLDGVALRTEPGRRAFARLQAGIPVDIELGRPGGPSTVRVIPTDQSGGMMFRAFGGNIGAVGPAPSGDINVFRFQDDSGDISEFQFGSDGPPAPGAFVVFSSDEGGSLQISVGEDGVPAFTMDGETVELQELEGALAGLGERLREGLGQLRLDVVVQPGGAHTRRHLVLEDPELAVRLEKARHEMLTTARAQLELLVERRGELERRGETPPVWAYRVQSGTGEAPDVVRSRPPAMGANVVRAIEQRLGGAEFRELTPDLAEYFEADSGLLVLRVISGTPAAAMGLRGGDVVVEVGGRPNPDMQMFRELASSEGEAGVEVKWIRKGTTHTGRLAGS